MRKICVALFVAWLVSSFLPSCKEIGPDIRLKDNQNQLIDTSYVESPVAPPETKNVLVEDFTGVQCVNCPAGHQIVASLKTQYPGRIIGASLHPFNSLGIPFAGLSTQDFRSHQVTDLFNYLVQIGFEPAGAVDRQLFSGETNILLDKSKWNNYATQQLSVATPVNVELSKTYDANSRQLTIDVELHYTQTVVDSNRLSIYLTESGVVSAQQDGSLIDTFYVHNDLVRQFITGTTGDDINYTREAGRVIRKVYRVTLDPAWVPGNMQIVAFVHQYQNAKSVYQTKEISVTN